uniref:EGF-like domain-containing protein n=1 Tax=Electrophorus electricus TaxID=8005 RepID=A0A4W4GT16_ELEEL
PFARMFRVLVFLFIFFHMPDPHISECVSRQELQSTVRQVHKVLLAHETSYVQTLRSLRKKLNLLQNSTAKEGSNTKPLANGRILGRVFPLGHEVHSLCQPGFQLSERAACKIRSTTSAKQSKRFRGNRVVFPMRVKKQSRGTCVSDIDECELFRLTQPGRLCLHTCMNTAGSYHCACPEGYSLSRDSRNCQDIDECERGVHNCTHEQVCVNTCGGHRCMEVKCPHFRNASYIKTSPL